MPVGRDTGFQVIHYVSVELAGATPFLGSGVVLGDLPVGAVITDFDLTIVTPFGAGVQLQVARTPSGAPLTNFNVNTAGKLKLVNALTPLSPSVFGQGGRFYLYLTGAFSPGGQAFVVLSYAPKIG